MRVADFAADWPHSHPRPTPETNTHYRQMVRRFVDRFGDHEIASITTAEVQVWALDNLSAFRYVRALLEDAKADGHLVVNPAVRVKVPKPPRRRRDEAVPTESEISQLLLAADAQMRAVVALAAIVGLRQSEILGLGYGGFSHEWSRTYVHQQLARDGVTLKPIKGKVKAREVDVFAWARPYILAWTNQAAASEVFVVGPLDHSGLRRRWDALREVAGVRCEFHQLRTFCASWLLEQGASPIDVAVQLHGHTDPTVVLSYYAMIDKGRALDRLRRVVDGVA